jgi:tetratricopeptide (TPR) repeat protein
MAAMVAGTMATMMPAAATDAQQPAAAATTNAAPTAQQLFDAGAAADATPDAAAAAKAWALLEQRTKPGSRSNSVAKVRRGGALFRAGDRQAAGKALRAGLAALPKTDATLAEDRLLANLRLGALAIDALDYAGAADFFVAAETDAGEPSEKLGALLGQVQAMTFVDPGRAKAALTRIEGIVAGIKIDDKVKATIAQRQSELLLNLGDFAGAKAAALRAVAASGGLTSRTSLSDVAVRSDAAIAMLLAGQPDQAREYMAMTGAGRLPKGEFDPAAEMRAPDCGGEAGLKPADVAVVEFSIADDGTVRSVAPIYAAGGGQVALEFARTVREWWWPAEQVAAIPAFYRYGARVEMRCSTAFQRPSIDNNVDALVEKWLTDKGVDVPDAANGPTALASQRAAVATAVAASPGSLATMAAVFRLSRNWALPDDEQSTLYDRGMRIAADHGAPPVVRLAFDRTLDGDDGNRRMKWRDRLAAMASSPPYGTDPQARAVLLLKLADSATARRAAEQQAVQSLRRIVDDSALSKDDPFKIGALVRLASLEQRAGKLEAARAAFEATGLDAKQCALLDARPKMVSMPGADAFPKEAMVWGFEGWAQVQFDIGADGKTTEQRALLSYPPFIFTRASTDFFKTTRFAKTYRPDGEPGCGGTLQRLSFKLPG